MSYVCIELIIACIYILILKSKTKPNRRVKNIDEMTILAKAANEFNLDLYSIMTTKDLKNRFRMKVKKVHPDCGGNTEEFIKVKKAYDILLPYTTI
jgi:hypothetical protein